MSARTIRAGAAVLGGAVVLAVAGCGGSSTPATQSSSGQSTPSTSAQGTPASPSGQSPQGRAGGMFSDANMTALAKDLGVSTTRLQQALAAARPAGAPNGTPPGGGQGSGRPPGGGQGSGRPPGGGGGGGAQLAAGLAEQLNLPTDQVQQALAKVLPGRPQGAAPPAASATPTQN
jgi:hypothetical protein